MNFNHEEIIKRLQEPFASKDVEWKIQVTTQDKTRGMAVAYLDARAVQKRLDEVVGPFNWKNVYSLWHDNSQICGISIYNAERNEWVTKFDGAENSDIEPIKGGLSDALKRAASAWGIGRYLYEMDDIWVEVEANEKTTDIRENQMGKLEAEYNAAVNKIFGSTPEQQAAPVPAAPPAKTAPTSAAPPSSAALADTSTASLVENSANDFKVQSIKPSGKASQLLELIGGTGEVITAYIKASDQVIAVGSHLRGVQMERKNSSFGEYNLITDYKAA